MNKRERYARDEVKQLQDAGYKIGKKRTVRLHTNPQDERKEHAHAKMAVAKVCAEVGYFIDSEVTHEPSGNIADIIAYGKEGRDSIVVELESEYTEELKRANVNKYHHGPIREVYTLPVESFGTDIERMHEYARSELGL